jgi:hypothetical protein
MNILWMLFGAPTVDGTMKAFNKVLQRLQTIYDYHVNQATVCDEKVDYYTAQRNEHEMEASKAFTTADKIRKSLFV